MISDKNQVRILNIEGQEIPVWVFGEEKNPPILFIHGYPYPFSNYTGDLPIKYLMKDFCIYAVDLPGYGKSASLSLPPEKFIELVEREIIKRPHVLFGVSHGGLISLKYASLGSKQVRGVIIAGTPYFTWMYLALRAWFLPRRFMTRKVLKILKSFSFLRSKKVKDIKVPVLLLYSKKDRIGTEKMGKVLEKKLPNASLTIVNDRSHGWLLHRVDKNEFLKEINKFLKQVLV